MVEVALEHVQEDTTASAVVSSLVTAVNTVSNIMLLCNYATLIFCIGRIYS